MTVSPAKMGDYVELIEADDYPVNQSVLMVTNIPRNSDTKDIVRFFHGTSESSYLFCMDRIPKSAEKIIILPFCSGLTINQICWHNQDMADAKAFVIFSSIDAIERAMKTSTRNLGNIRMYRSSVQQLEYHCNKDTAKLQRSSSQLSLPGNGNRPNASLSRMKKYSSQLSLSSTSFELSNGAANQQRQINENRQRRLSQLSSPYNSLSLANLHQLIDDKSNANGNDSTAENAEHDKNVNRVKARGFPWKVTKADVIGFFQGIDIPNGEESIRIVKNVAMEAYVDFATAKDHDIATSRNGRFFKSYKILGNF